MINLKFLLQPHHKYKHHTVWRTWLFIACSDERCLYYQFSQSHIYISLSKGWENVLFELGRERGAYENCNEGAMYSQNTVILFQIKHRTHVVFRMYLCFSSSVKPRYVSFPSPSPPNFTVLCSLMNCKGANTSPQEGGMGGGRGGTTAGKTFALDTPTESPENRLVCLKTDKERLGENTRGNGKESKRRGRGENDGRNGADRLEIRNNAEWLDDLWDGSKQTMKRVVFEMKTQEWVHNRENPVCGEKRCPWLRHLQQWR